MNYQRLSKRESSLSQEKDFYSILKNFFLYPFREGKEKRTFSYLFKQYPQVNFLIGLKKAFAYWEEHPKALGKNPREQLLEEFLWQEVKDWQNESTLKAIEQSNKG